MGSSPLTRGKPCRPFSQPTSIGLIPAHAGKTPKRRAILTTDQAHPRSRGENRPRPSQSTATAGSSPLTRGKHAAVASQEIVGRLIPAHAGKTPGAAPRWTEPTAHPRSRGENLGSAFGRDNPEGSSPLTRGKPGITVKHNGNERLIPAHAGKTSTCGRRSTSWTAHPRSRGENAAAWTDEVAATGSSPLTRGKRLVKFLGGDLARLIPAHAGKTSCSVEPLGSVGAHPRSRGENPSDSAGV